MTPICASQSYHKKLKRSLTCIYIQNLQTECPDDSSNPLDNNIFSSLKDKKRFNCFHQIVTLFANQNKDGCPPPICKETESQQGET